MSEIGSGILPALVLQGSPVLPARGFGVQVCVGVTAELPGVTVFVGNGISVGVLVAVGVGVTVGVFVAVKVCVTVKVRVGVSVFVGVNTVHTLGAVPVQLYPASTVQDALHPSPAAVLPSSQASPAVEMPLPQAVTVQLLSQPIAADRVAVVARLWRLSDPVAACDGVGRFPE